MEGQAYESIGNKLNHHLSGNNDAIIPGMDAGISPDIDVHQNISVKTTNWGSNGDTLLSITGKISGDQFPSVESFVRDRKGNAVFLGVAQANGTQQNGLVTNLFGDRKLPMASLNVQIVVNKHGIFSHVLENRNKVSIADWNARFTRQSPVTDRAKILTEIENTPSTCPATSVCGGQ